MSYRRNEYDRRLAPRHEDQVKSRTWSDALGVGVLLGIVMVGLWVGVRLWT